MSFLDVTCLCLNLANFALKVCVYGCLNKVSYDGVASEGIQTLCLKGDKRLGNRAFMGCLCDVLNLALDVLQDELSHVRGGEFLVVLRVYVHHELSSDWVLHQLYGLTLILATNAKALGLVADDANPV